MKTLQITLLFVLISTAAQANSVYPVLRGSAEFGGEELATVQFRDGDDDTTRVGDGFQIAVGVGMDHSRSWESSLTVGYRIGGTTAENGDLDLSSVPVELITFHRTPLWRVGAGVNYVSNVQLEGSGVVDNLDVDFKDAMGFIVEADWFFRHNPKMFFGVRGTVIDYETELTGQRVNGNSFGLVFGTGF